MNTVFTLPFTKTSFKFQDRVDLETTVPLCSLKGSSFCLVGTLHMLFPFPGVPSHKPCIISFPASPEVFQAHCSVGSVTVLLTTLTCPSQHTLTCYYQYVDALIQLKNANFGPTHMIMPSMT